MPTFIHHGGNSLLHQDHYKNMFHAVDILPTILTAIGAGANVEDKGLDLDGVSHWHALMSASGISGAWKFYLKDLDLFTGLSPAAPRNHMIYNIDDELVSEILNIKNRTSAFQVEAFLLHSP